MAAAAAPAPGGAAVGGSNPSGDGVPRLKSPPGKGNKPVALADITNIGRPNTTSRSVSIGDVLKENTKLIHLVSEKAKIIEISRVEIHKLRIALQRLSQNNLQITQAHSQMLAELNMAKDRIKTLQHELSCTTALLKVKDSELERKNKTAKQWKKETNSHEVLKAISSKGAAVEAHQIHSSVTSGVEHQLLKYQSAVPSRTVCQEPPQDATLKRGKNKRKSVSNECIKDTNIMQEHYKPHLQPILSMDHEDPRKTQRRRSSRLNQVPCEIAEVSHKTLHEDIIVPSSSSTLSVQEQHGPTTGKDTGKSLQNECSAVVHEELMSSVVEEIEINEQPQKEVNLKVQEACSSVTGVEAHQIDVKACDTKQSHLTSQSSVPFNITEPPKPTPEDTCIKRKSQRRKSARLNSASSENTDNTFETLHEDVIAPLASSSSIASMEQKTTQKHNDACSSVKSTEGQVVAGRRSLRRAAEKVVSYKEIPLNVKMRRP